MLQNLSLLLAKSSTSNSFLGVSTSKNVSNTLDAAGDTAGFLVNNPFITKLLSVLLAIVVAGFLIWLSKIIANFVANKIKNNFHDKDADSINKIGQLVGDLIFYAMATFSVYLGFKIV